MSRIEFRSPVTLPPVALSPEEAAAVAVALAAQPEGPYAAAGRAALAKIVEALEPDPRRRAQLLAAVDRVEAERPAGAGAHPAGRRRTAGAPKPPQLVVLPGGLT